MQKLWVLLVLLSSAHAGATCLKDAVAADRWAHIAVATQGCENFSRLRIDSPVGWIADKLLADDKHCTGEIQAIWRAVDANKADAGFCREAQRRRDQAVGTPGRKPIGELVAIARSKLRVDEQVVGIWVDENHICGVVTITRRL